MVGPHHSSNNKAITVAKKNEVTKRAPNPKPSKKKTSENPILTPSSNLTSNFISNIIETNKINTQNEQKKIPEKKVLSRTDNQKIQETTNIINKSKKIYSKEVSFKICEDDNKPTGKNYDIQISSVHSEIEVRQTESAAKSSFTSNLSMQQKGDQHQLMMSNAMINYNEWSVYQNKVFLNHEKTLILLDKYVKNELFHQLKFISCPEMMNFSWEAQSICQVVCTKFNVPKNGHVGFWSQYSKTIIQKLNKMRSDVSHAMKKAFKGM